MSSRAKKLLALVGTAAVVVSLAPAGAQVLVPPRFRTERTYVHCGATPKAQVVDGLQGQTPTWNTIAPTQSVQQGAGCGTSEAPGLSGWVGNEGVNSVSDLFWRGTFTGNLDSLTVRAHAIWAGPGKAFELALNDGFGGLSLDLQIDGQDIAIPLDADGNQGFEAKVVKSTTGASSEFIFSVDDLDFIDPVTDIDNNGIADNEGTTEHTIRLAVNAYWLDSNPAMVWVWDTTDVPSGIHFNPLTLEGPILPRIN